RPPWEEDRNELEARWNRPRLTPGDRKHLQELVKERIANRDDVRDVDAYRLRLSRMDRTLAGVNNCVRQEQAKSRVRAQHSRCGATRRSAERVHISHPLAGHRRNELGLHAAQRNRGALKVRHYPGKLFP